MGCKNGMLMELKPAELNISIGEKKNSPFQIKLNPFGEYMSIIGCKCQLK